VGWGYASASIANVLNRIRLPFNTSTMGQAAAVAALADSDFVARSLSLVRDGRPTLERLLRNAGLVILPSAANFVTALASSADEATRIDRGLAERGILVRALSNYGMPNAIRVTIGDDEQLSALERALAEHG
jgi:histidinol-phosphate aminotransferase